MLSIVACAINVTVISMDVGIKKTIDSTASTTYFCYVATKYVEQNIFKHSID